MLSYIQPYTLISVVYSELDEHTPAWVDKNELLLRWEHMFDGQGHYSVHADWDSKSSGIIEGATHTMEVPTQARQRKDLAERVTNTLKAVEEQKTTEEIRVENGGLQPRKRRVRTPTSSEDEDEDEGVDEE